jgi:hypothetical protein
MVINARRTNRFKTAAINPRSKSLEPSKSTIIAKINETDSGHIWGHSALQLAPSIKDSLPSVDWPTRPLIRAY